VRIALFVTCFNDTLFPETGKAVVRLLERLGHEVEFPEEQTCCGQMHVNTGYRREAAELARRFVSVFAGCETIVSPSASCVGMVRDVYPELAREHGFAAEAEAVVPRVHELSELLVDRLGVEDVGACYPHRVAYHPTCHSLRVLGVREAPLRLLRAVQGLELVEHSEPEECCGFGGTFAVKNSATSAAMLADKCRCLESSGAAVVSSSDNSCLMHIGGGLSREGAQIRPVHLAEILASTAADAA
jgi:L-lactate dehydrogenase complex protein LldE